MTDKPKRTAAQIEAERRYKAKTSGRPSLPGVRISEDEAALLEEMAAIYGSKKEAIIKGLEELKKKDGKIDKY